MQLLISREERQVYLAGIFIFIYAIYIAYFFIKIIKFLYLNKL